MEVIVASSASGSVVLASTPDGAAATYMNITRPALTCARDCTFDTSGRRDSYTFDIYLISFVLRDAGHPLQSQVSIQLHCDAGAHTTRRPFRTSPVSKTKQVGLPPLCA